MGGLLIFGMFAVAAFFLGAGILVASDEPTGATVVSLIGIVVAIVVLVFGIWGVRDIERLSCTAETAALVEQYNSSDATSDSLRDELGLFE